ncbi:hypothetical protein FS749_016576 [Ceratobasidium sp. UAMH 11750]|nr:hypothetical protein FS749_016576 [Ceratobasidium sp. UAMH 11750]
MADASVGAIATPEEPAAPEDPAAEVEIQEDQGKYYSALSPPGSPPAPAPSDAPQEGHVSAASAGANNTPDTTHASNGTAAAAEVFLAQIHERAAELRAKPARLDEGMEVFEAGDSAPQQRNWLLESDVLVASSSVERWKTEIRARDNVSPLAHKSLKRSSGSLGRVSLAPKSAGSQPGAPQLDGAVADGLDSARSTTFKPAATSSSVCARQAGSSAVNRVRRATRDANPASPDVFFPQAGPSQVREPLPPRSCKWSLNLIGTVIDSFPAAFVTFGALAAASESKAPVAGSSAERWKTKMRARVNVSPLAHKGSRRSSGLSLGEVLSARQGSSSRAQPEEPQAGGCDADDVEGDRFSPATTSTPMGPCRTVAAHDPESAESTGFRPFATSSPRQVVIDRFDRQRAARSAHRVPSRPQADPSEPREPRPRPPYTHVYLAFGTLAEYPPSVRSRT